jgi:hypothetical protein
MIGTTSMGNTDPSFAAWNNQQFDSLCSMLCTRAKWFGKCFWDTSFLPIKQTEIKEDLKQVWQEYQKHLAICIKKREDMALWDKEYGQLLLESCLAKKGLLKFYKLENDNLLPSKCCELQEDRMALNADIAKLNAERKALKTMGKEAFNAFK